MKLKTWASLIVAAGLLVLVAVPTAIGQQPDDEARESDSVTEQFSATFEVEDGKKAARKKINRNIERLVDDMSFIKRPFARGKLKDKTAPCAALDISFPSDKISVECDNRPAYVSPTGNEKARYKSAEGVVYALRQNLDGRTLTQTFVSEDGTRTNTMKLTPSGETILMRVKLESDQLPRPLEYSLTYEKK